MTREQQIECLDIIAKAFDLEMFVEKTRTIQSRGFSFSSLNIEQDMIAERITLLWGHTREEEHILQYVYLDVGETFANGNMRPYDCTYKKLKTLIQTLQNRHLLCHKLLSNNGELIDEYMPYRNAYVPSFNSPEELRLKLAIANGK